MKIVVLKPLVSGKYSQFSEMQNDDLEHCERNV